MNTSFEYLNDEESLNIMTYINNTSEYLNDKESLNIMTYINNTFNLDLGLSAGDVDEIWDFKIMIEDFKKESNTLEYWLLDPDFNVDQMNSNVDRINKYIGQIDYMLPEAQYEKLILDNMDLIDYKDNFINIEFGMNQCSIDRDEDNSEEEEENYILLCSRMSYVQEFYKIFGNNYNKVLTRHFGTEFDEAIEYFIDHAKEGLDDELNI